MAVPAILDSSIDTAFDIYRLHPTVYHDIAELGRAAGVEVGPECIFEESALSDFLAALVRLGGSWSPASEMVEWYSTAHFLPSATADLEPLGPDFNLAEAGVPRCLFHGNGVLLLRLGDEAVLVAGVWPRGGPGRMAVGAMVFFGRSRSALADFLRRVWSARPVSRIRVWGCPLRQATPPAVAEEEVVLATPLKAELLGWLDRFWLLRDRAREHRLPLRRGLLLVGAPGTGKTHFVRHLLTRYPDAPAHLFIAARQGMREDPFGDMLSAVRACDHGAIVILEDIDRMAESGMVTKEFLLNCLDGFLELPVPLLWVATSNDPTILDRSLLQRPGRFDRTVVFQLPGAEERRKLISRFSTLSLEPGLLLKAVAASDGLTGAHLREACASAILASLDAEETYGEVLHREIESLRRQHEQARELERGEMARGTVGYHSHAGAD